MLIDELVMRISMGDHSLLMSRAAVSDASVKAGFTLCDVQKIVSAVGEACVNAVTHGCANNNEYATLCIRRYTDRLEVEVRDSGSGFTCPTNTPIPPPSARRGRGIPLMRSFMDEVEFELDGGCRVVMVKYIVF